jgi:hypothetical protein
MKKLFSLAIAALVLAAPGCGATQKCPDVGQSVKDLAAQDYEGRCATRQDVEHEKHSEQIKKEEGEVESVIKKRAAEETANALEGATR